MAPDAVGDKVLSVTLFENSPGNKVDLAELCAGRKVVIFGVPGAFTTGCSKTHLPGYVEAAAELKSKRGVDEIVCILGEGPGCRRQGANAGGHSWRHCQGTRPSAGSGGRARQCALQEVLHPL